MPIFRYFIYVNSNWDENNWGSRDWNEFRVRVFLFLVVHISSIIHYESYLTHIYYNQMTAKLDELVKGVTSWPLHQCNGQLEAGSFSFVFIPFSSGISQSRSAPLLYLIIGLARMESKSWPSSVPSNRYFVRPLSCSPSASLFRPILAKECRLWYIITPSKIPLSQFFHNRYNPISITDVIIACYDTDPMQHIRLNYREAAFIAFHS